MKLVNIGYGNLVAQGRIVSIIAPEAAPIKRIISDAKGAGHLIDASCGRATASVIVCDNGMIILSAATPQTLRGRIESDEKGEDVGEL